MAPSAGSRSPGRWRRSRGCCCSTSLRPGLNPSEVGELAEIIRDIRRDGVTVVLIEHNMGLVMSLCDRVTVLDAGRVIAEGPPEAVANDAAVVSAYLGDANLFDAPSEVGDNDARQ